MNYDYKFLTQRFIQCSKGARILLVGIRDPNAPDKTILVCPIHQDKIIVPAGMPRRIWLVKDVTAEGSPMVMWSSYWARLREKRRKPSDTGEYPRVPIYDHGSKSRGV